MGIDLLDIRLRIEEALGLKLDPNFFLRIIEEHHPRFREPGQPRPDVTAGEICNTLICLLKSHHRLEERTAGTPAPSREAMLAVLREQYSRPELTMSSETQSLWKYIVTVPEWEELGRRFDVNLPPLEVPNIWISRAIQLATLITPIGLIIQGGYLPFAVLLALGGLVLILEREGRNPIPPSIRKIGQLIDYVIFESERTHGFLSEHLVWRKLTAILVDVLGVDEEEVTRDARLIADLGCG